MPEHLKAQKAAMDAELLNQFNNEMHCSVHYTPKKEDMRKKKINTTIILDNERIPPPQSKAGMPQYPAHWIIERPEDVSPEAHEWGLKEQERRANRTGAYQEGLMLFQREQFRLNYLETAKREAEREAVAAGVIFESFTNEQVLMRNQEAFNLWDLQHT